ADHVDVCVLAAGDPGWFGIVRALTERFGRDGVRVLPTPSSVSVAFARLSMAWDDAVVVSAHGRPLHDAARLAGRAAKVAVLTSPDAPPQALGAALLEIGASHEHAAECSRLGLPGETVTLTDLGGLTSGSWDGLSVVVLWSGSGTAAAKSLAWGLPEHAYAHRASMITKSEVRAVVLGLLALPPPSTPAPIMWDIGAGSGSVAIECERVAPWLETVAVDRDPDASATCRANAAAHGVAIRVLTADAPECLECLADPDRIFIGGGGIDVLRAARRRLRPAGVIVATHAAMDRAIAAADLLGNMTQIAASRGLRLPDGAWRLEAANPVFVTWGCAP
ncbi:MAG: precorrin-6y C5,15-methyltransferase (decarboxylating) subunit CbiE, partial [Acidimicrobiales bacterium]